MDKLLYSRSKTEGLSDYFNKDFSNSFTENSNLFSFLIVIGVTAMLAILFLDLVIRKKKEKIKLKKIKKNKKKKATDGLEEGVGNEEIQNYDEKEILTQEKILSNKVNKDQFKKCSLHSVRQYFIINYFIRVYQITMIKTTLTCLIVITNSNVSNPNRLEILISYFVLFVWIFGMPVFLFCYLREKQSFLMSPQFIVRFGAFYLNYRGIYKDVYSLLTKFKYVVFPMICVCFENFPLIQLILLTIIYLFNLLLITIFTPFCKVSKVFTEAISEGIILALVVILLLKEYIKTIDESIYTRYILFSLIILIFSIRGFRVIIDTFIRVRDLIRMRSPERVQEAKEKKPKHKTYKAESIEMTNQKEIPENLKLFVKNIAKIPDLNNNVSPTVTANTILDKDHSFFEDKDSKYYTTRNDNDITSLSSRKLINKNNKNLEVLSKDLNSVQTNKINNLAEKAKEQFDVEKSSINKEDILNERLNENLKENPKETLASQTYMNSMEKELFGRVTIQSEYSEKYEKISQIKLDINTGNESEMNHNISEGKNKKQSYENDIFSKENASNKIQRSKKFIPQNNKSSKSKSNTSKIKDMNNNIDYTKIKPIEVNETLSIEEGTKSQFSIKTERDLPIIKEEIRRRKANFIQEEGSELESSFETISKSKSNANSSLHGVGLK